MSAVSVTISAEDNTGPGVTAAESRFKRFGDRVKALVTGNLITGAFSKLGGFLADSANRMGDLVDASDELGVSVETLDRIGRIFKGAGVEIEETRKAMRNLQVQQAAVKDGSVDAADKFAKVGIAISQVESLGLEDLFFKVSDGLAGIEDPAAAATSQMELMGSKSAKALSTMVQGSNALKEAMKGVQGAITNETARQVDDTSDQIEDMKTAVGGWTSEQVANAWRGSKSLFQKIKDQVIPPMLQGGHQTAPEVNGSEEFKRDAKAKAAAAKVLADQELQDRKEAKADIASMSSDRDRIFDAQKEANKAAYEALTIDEKRHDVLLRIAEAVRLSADGKDAPKAKAKADLAELRNELAEMDRQKAKLLGLSGPEQAAARKKQRQDEREQERGVRRMRNREAEAIDRGQAEFERTHGKSGITPEEAQVRKDAAGISLTRKEIDTMARRGDITSEQRRALESDLRRGHGSLNKQTVQDRLNMGMARDINQVNRAIQRMEQKIGVQ